MKKYCVVDSVDVYVTSLDSWSPNLKGTTIVVVLLCEQENEEKELL